MAESKSNRIRNCTYTFGVFLKIVIRFKLKADENLKRALTNRYYKIKSPYLFPSKRISLWNNDKM